MARERDAEIVALFHRTLREKPRPSGRGGIAGRVNASLWDRTYCEITDRGAPPHDAAK